MVHVDEVVEKIGHADVRKDGYDKPILLTLFSCVKHAKMHNKSTFTCAILKTVVNDNLGSSESVMLSVETNNSKK